MIAESNGRATGVLEVYLPYDAIATKVAGQTRTEIQRVAISLSALFALLALVSWWTTRTLRQNAATTSTSPARLTDRTTQPGAVPARC